jgi:hypothetical protein
VPPSVRDVAGDLLWATMTVWLVSIVLPHVVRVRRGALALVLCCAVELSQLVRWGWLVALRAHPLGHLALGSDFDTRDLVAYLTGVSLAVLLEWGMNTVRPPRHNAGGGETGTNVS